MLYCLRSDLPLLEASTDAVKRLKRQHEPSQPIIRLLAPLDPLIYDRRITSALWNFDYTWEAYTPPAKRVRGHYALPVLAGSELVGHVEPKADRTEGKLNVVSHAVQRGIGTAEAVGGLARWLGLKR
jgi:hypothetical protein